jgi:hypothetical protein
MVCGAFWALVELLALGAFLAFLFTLGAWLSGAL